MLSLPVKKPTNAGPVPRLQRKCECGAAPRSLRACPACGPGPSGLQRKLEIGRVDDPLEREADRIADSVLAGGGASDSSRIPVTVQRHGAASGPAAGTAPPSVHRALAEPGRPLDAAVRRDLEPRFGRDFSNVRIYDGAAAGESARELGASAYTVGNDVVFQPGRYAPASGKGRWLLAHELAHVTQQQEAVTVRRQTGPTSIPILPNPILGVFQYLDEVSNRPGTGAVYTSTTRACPPTFCNPFADVQQAREDLRIVRPLLVAAIGMKINSRIAPLWYLHLSGGTSQINLSGAFAADFTKSLTTAETTRLLRAALRVDMENEAEKLLGGAKSGNHFYRTGGKSNPPVLDYVLTAINDQQSPIPMNFDYFEEVPGNIAGAIGNDQLTNKFGRMKSTVNDSRVAVVDVQLARTASGIKVTPRISFRVDDTLDLCPGDCGDASLGEQLATIPLSRFEATEMAGDVPFWVNFPAPTEWAEPFEIVPGAAKGPAQAPAQTGVPSQQPTKARGN